ncbi:hypothetical protein A6A06_04900 [Streptomyces sp. CB02923]|uniref:hypothetical protein n=1 Tax=Streptomyces sp. CB02923 TaxID=1718985 RepID=UPI00093E184D|nr:hypothetical protein [Streptomyces sp. CB02923]OKI09961.1 hypothetical protein A6A06_04900 [Streptomyces sp. CB02923]
MKRHTFEPARLLTGLTAAGVGGAYAGEAAGAWDLPGALPMLAVPVGLFLSGVTAAVWSAVRRHRSTSPSESEAAPESTSARG